MIILNDELSGQLATKSDLVQVENSLEHKMMQIENRLLKWMIGLVLAFTAINVTVIGLLVTL